jgi:hypothetical protein
MFVGEKSSKK